MERLCPLSCQIHSIAGFDQAILNKSCDSRFVLDHQNTHGGVPLLRLYLSARYRELVYVTVVHILYCLYVCSQLYPRNLMNRLSYTSYVLPSRWFMHRANLIYSSGCRSMLEGKSSTPITHRIAQRVVEIDFTAHTCAA